MLEANPTTTTHLLNTSLSLPAVGLPTYFKSVSKLGDYGLLLIRLKNGERGRIVIDQHMPWLQKRVDQFFARVVESLTLDEIQKFLAHLRTSTTGFQLQTFLGLAPHKDLNRAERVQVYYLDDLQENRDSRPLFLAVTLQILIERFTKLDSRLAVIELTHGSQETRRCYAVFVRIKHDRSLSAAKQNSKDASQAAQTQTPPAPAYQLLDPMQNLTSAPWTEPSQEVRDRTGKVFRGDLSYSDLQVQHPETRYSERNKVFSIIAGDGRELCFQVTGRTPAEKRFAREQELIQRANDPDLVPIEIGFHPYWRRLGHTTLRIGESLYEMSSKGWKVHGSGADSARAYIFNNPFFKEQFSIYRHTGMPPISLAVTLMVEKRKVMVLQTSCENLVAAQGRAREKFSLMMNNCNHAIMRVLTQSGLEGFEAKGFMGFSSVLSFRQVLLYCKHPVAALHIYPLPGTEMTEVSLRRWIPRLLYRYNDVMMEAARAIPSLAWDALVLLGKRTNTLVFKVFKVRLWREHELYHMNP